VLKEVPNISGRSWTLPSPHHLGGKNVAFEKLYGSKEGAFVLLLEVG
jgi:hypothetical protein